MDTLQVLMPMGGLGERFRMAKVATPKPLIEVAGVPMFQRALGSFESLEATIKLVVVVRKADQDDFNLAGRIRQVRPGASVVILDHNTRGPVETCLAAEASVDPDLPLVILDCDLSFRSPGYLTAMVRAADGGQVDGLLLSFTSLDPRYSFAQVDGTGLVVRTAEKQPISSHALAGAYFFTAAGSFFDAARALVQDRLSAQMPEYYVSLIYNRLIASGGRIKLIEGEVFSFGTPEELAAFEARFSGQGPI